MQQLIKLKPILTANTSVKAGQALERKVPEKGVEVHTGQCLSLFYFR